MYVDKYIYISIIYEDFTCKTLRRVKPPNKHNRRSPACKCDPDMMVVKDYQGRCTNYA